MSGLGKNAGGKAQNEESLDELKVEFEESKNKIRKLVDGRKDKKDIPSEEKSKLSTEYLRASMLAKKLPRARRIMRRRKNIRIIQKNSATRRLLTVLRLKVKFPTPLSTT